MVRLTDRHYMTEILLTWCQSNVTSANQLFRLSVTSLMRTRFRIGYGSAETNDG